MVQLERVREVNFIIVTNKKPTLAIECKWSDTEISPALKYFKTRFPDCEAWKISAVGNKDYIGDLGVRVCPAIRFLSTLV